MADRVGHDGTADRGDYDFVVSFVRGILSSLLLASLFL